MKMNPFVVACTFMLGCLVTILAINTFKTPVKAEPASLGAAPGVTAITVQVGSDREMLVVFKEVDESLWFKDEKSTPHMAMAVYEIYTTGQQQAAINLVASRYIDWDMKLPYHLTTKSKESNLAKFIEKLEKDTEGIEEQREKWKKKNK